MIDRSDPRPTRLIVDIGATGDLDTTTSDALNELVTRLQEDHVELLLAQVKGQVRDRMRRSGLMDAIGEDTFIGPWPKRSAASNSHAAEALVDRDASAFAILSRTTVG